MTIYQVHATVKNNTSFELVPHDTPFEMWHGDSTGGPARIGPNTASGNAGTYLAKQSTWTGTSGTILYRTPDENAILALFFNLPYVGHNASAVAVLHKTDAIDSNIPSRMFDNDSTTKSFSANVDGRTQNFVLTSAITQGTDITATYTLDVTG